MKNEIDLTLEVTWPLEEKDAECQMFLLDTMEMESEEEAHMLLEMSRSTPPLTIPVLELAEARSSVLLLPAPGLKASIRLRTTNH